MVTEWQFVTDTAARAAARAGLGLGGTAGRTEVLSELARAVVWASRHGTEPVHVARITHRVCALAAAIGIVSDEGLREQCHEALQGLHDAGDLVELAGGYWTPAAARLVELGTDTKHLLVGGIPTRLLGADVRVDHHGPFRRTSDVQPFGDLHLPIETLASWARLPSESLRDWAEDILGVDLATYSPTTDTLVHQIYQPQPVRAGIPQVFRWTDRLDRDGRFLAYRLRAFGVREFRLVDVVAGSIRRAGAVLAPREARRLMYAVDDRAGNPVSVDWRTDSRGVAHLTTRNPLPAAEQRLFGALGTVDVDLLRVYEHHWTFTSDHELVMQRLLELHVHVRTASRHTA